MKTLFLLLISSFLSVDPIYSQTDTSDVSSFEIEILSFEDLLKMGLDVASFEEKNIFNTPSTVSVVDKETIKRFNYTSISEALNSIAGISVMRTYLKRNLPTSRGILQDNYANKVLVMINNVPAWHASTGEGNLDRVDINDVERIEVLKGPASVPYGTNAYSGAINIVLKKSNRNSTSGTVRFGENGLISGGGSFIYSDENYSLLISANSKSETGYDYLFTDQSAVAGHINEYIRSSNFTANLDYKEHNFL